MQEKGNLSRALQEAEGRALAAEAALTVSQAREEQTLEQLKGSVAECQCLQAHINALTADLNAAADLSHKVCHHLDARVDFTMLCCVSSLNHA